ncbi:MAG: hypothetical protein ACRDV9_13560 [Acidimicrobiia bacterium]
MSLFRSATALLLSAVALVSCGSGGAETATPVTFKGPDFQVKLPGAPKQDQKSLPTPLGDVKIRSYIVEGKEISIGVSVADLPLPDGFDVEAALNAVGEGAAKDVDGKLASSTPVTVQGRAGRDIHVTEARKGKASAWIRVIIDNKTQYQILTTQVGGKTEKAPASHLTAIESFGFLK